MLGQRAPAPACGTDAAQPDFGDDRAVIRLAISLFLIQAGFHGFTASIPLALGRAGRLDADIGAIVGIAPLVQLPAALVGGALIDRFGGIKLIAFGALAYIVGAAILLIPGLDPATSTLQFVASRVLQGLGFGIVMPSALSLVPRLAPIERRGVALATAQSAHNVIFIVAPLISIIALDLAGLQGVVLLVGASVIAGVALAFARPFRLRPPDEASLHKARRTLGFAYRRAWTAPLAVIALFVIHWGVVTAYLPTRADAAGADIGLFFAADGLFVLLARLPAGLVADRVAALWQVLFGLAVTAVGVVLVLFPPTTPLLVAAGALTGAGAAFITVPITLALAHRSNEADRGSAFALFSASFAAAIAAGSIGTAPFIESVGYEVVLSVSIAALGIAAVICFLDRELGQVPSREDRAAGSESVATSPAGP
jgi:MFS family permease